MEKPFQTPKRSRLQYAVEKIRRVRHVSCNSDEPFECLTSPLMRQTTSSLLRAKGFTPAGDYGERETETEKKEYPTLCF